MPDFETLRAAQLQLVRKALQAAIWIAPEDAAMPAADPFAADGTITLPTDYKPVGAVDKGDALTWGRKTDTSDVTSLGFTEPVRSDITKVTNTLKFTAQETHRLNLEMYLGLDLSALTPTASTGTVSFAEPSRPETKFWRAFGLAKDGSGTNTIYIGRLLTRCNITDVEDQKWADGDDAIGFGITMTSYQDSTLGYGVRHYFGGPGWKKQLESMGFPAVTP